MKNVKVEVKKNVLTLTVDLTQDFGPSKSGKTNLIATTEGNVKIDGPKGDVFIGLNIYKK
jgi:hypothetical protein